MTAFPTEDRLRQKRTKSEQAISLAMKNRWQEAADLNREILEAFPNEVDAYNRLGKALTGGFPLSACALVTASSSVPMMLLLAFA